MKIRAGFVSNSSSSSFTCECCGEIESGMDASLIDMDMYQCKNGHEFHEGCNKKVDFNNLDRKEIAKELIKEFIEMKEDEIKSDVDNKYAKEHLEDAKKQLEELDKKDEEAIDEILEEYEFRYSVPSKYCPICTFKNTKSSDLLKYLLKKSNSTQEDLLKEIEKEFGDYDKYLVYIKE